MPSVVILTSRLTRDPEMRFTQSGTAIAEFCVVESRKMGEREEVSFIDVKAWGQQAEFVSKYFKKGDVIHVVGRLTQESWEDKAAGTKRSKVIVTAENISFVPGTNSSGGKDQTEDSPASQRNNSSSSAKTNAAPTQRQTRNPRQALTTTPKTPKVAEVVQVPEDEDIPF